MVTSCKPPDDTYRKLTGDCVADRDFPDADSGGAHGTEASAEAVAPPAVQNLEVTDL